MRAWGMLGVVFIAYTLSAIDRQILNLLVPDLRADLGLSDTQISLLQGFAFTILYTVAGFPLGRAADRNSRRLLIAAGIAAWSVMTAMCGLARTFWQLAAARAGVGIGEASLSPAAYSLISDSFAARHRALAISVYQIGYPLGGGLALIIGGAVLALLHRLGPIELPLFGAMRNWQLAFMIVGLPGVLIALIMLAVREPARRERLHANAEGGLRLREVIGQLRSQGYIYTVHMLAVSLLGLLAIGTAVWYPTFLARTYNMDMVHAGYLYGSLVLVCGTVGTLSGGLIASWLARRGDRMANFRIMVWACALKILPLAVGPMMATPALALALMAVATLIGQMSQGVAIAILQDITPNEMRGQVSATQLLGVNLIGIGGGATMVALFTDFVFRDPQAIGMALSATTLIVGPAVLALLLGSRRVYVRTLGAEPADIGAGKPYAQRHSAT
jgi:MFS family permease